MLGQNGATNGPLLELVCWAPKAHGGQKKHLITEAIGAKGRESMCRKQVEAKHEVGGNIVSTNIEPQIN
jgi:hypothetical protein